MEETVYFDQNGIKVTNTRFVTTGKTIAMRNVASVSFCRGNIPNICWVLLLPSIIFMLAGFNSNDYAYGVVGFLLTAFIIFVMWYNYTKFNVFIDTSNGGYSALEKRDRMFIFSVFEAVEKSIIERK